MKQYSLYYKINFIADDGGPGEGPQSVIIAAGYTDSFGGDGYELTGSHTVGSLETLADGVIEAIRATRGWTAATRTSIEATPVDEYLVLSP